MTELLTVAEAAQRLRKSTEFVNREIRRKNLRAAKFGNAWHVAQADLDAYIEAAMNVSRVRKAT